MSITWPDIIIIGLVILSALKGWKRGFIAELAGFVALAIAVLAAFRYDGTFDGAVSGVTHLGPGSSHVIAMVLFAVAVYAVLSTIAWALGRFAKLPFVNIGNAAGGGIVGIFKALLGLWAVIYVALFFPLSNDLRGDLHRSTLVVLLASPNPQVDDVVRGALPWFVRPFVGPIFTTHRV